MSFGALYDLGYHLVAKRLCRIPGKIITSRVPSNCVRVIWYKEKGQRYKRYPLDEDGELKPEYWAINRHSDFDRQLGINKRSSLNDLIIIHTLNP